MALRQLVLEAVKGGSWHQGSSRFRRSKEAVSIEAVGIEAVRA